ncbi:15186_t:CDS:2, partial [Gigaspora rosea]
FIHAYSRIRSSSGQSLKSYNNIEKQINGQSNKDVIKTSIKTPHGAHPTIHRETLKKASTGSSASKNNMIINKNSKISCSYVPSPKTTKRTLSENKMDDYMRARAVLP